MAESDDIVPTGPQPSSWIDAYEASKIETLVQSTKERQEMQDLLKTLNAGQLAAYFALVRGTSNIFITGAGGCGKTHLLKVIIAYYTYKFYNASDRVCVSAPTESASSNLGGHNIFRTLRFVMKYDHRLKLFKPSHDWRVSRGPRDYLDRTFKFLRVLIIDEISMLSQQALSEIDAVLKMSNPGIVFITCGDLMQLEPVANQHEMPPDAKPGFMYPFNCDAWRDRFAGNTFLLEQQQRHSGDMLFAELCMALRCGKVKPRHAAALRLLVSPVRPRDAVVIAPDNRTVSKYNTQIIAEFPGEEVHLTGRLIYVRRLLNGKREFTESTFGVQGFPADSAALRAYCTTPYACVLKPGVPIVVTANVDKYVYNGRMGKFIELDEHDFVVVSFNGIDRTHIKKLDVPIPCSHSSTVQHVLRAYPIDLACAMTVDRCQGMTIPGNVFIDFTGIKPSSIRCGIFYTAVSRATAYDKVFLQGFQTHYVKTNPDALAISYGQSPETVDVPDFTFERIEELRKAVQARRDRLQ